MYPIVFSGINDDPNFTFAIFNADFSISDNDL